jgi:hypothetical protein
VAFIGSGLERRGPAIKRNGGWRRCSLNATVSTFLRLEIAPRGGEPEGAWLGVEAEVVQKVNWWPELCSVAKVAGTKQRQCLVVRRLKKG